MPAVAFPRSRIGMASLRPGGVGDERLAQLVAQGDERAFRLLYDRYHQRLYRYCQSLLHHEADAQDALQSTFTSAFTALQSGRRDAPMRPWLFRIAHNESISVVRRRPAEQELTDTLEPATTTLEERVDGRQRLSLLVADLHELPDRQRGALVMRELSGLSHEDIALALDTSVNAAKQTIFEARRSLTEFAEGRAMDCDDVCRLISDADGRALRARRVRAHLRHCSGCAAFAAAISQRGAQLRALAPPLPALAAAGILSQMLGGGSGHSGGTGLLAAGAGKGAGSAVAAKATAVVVAATAAVGVAAAVKQLAPGHSTGRARAALRSQGATPIGAASGQLPGARTAGASAVSAPTSPARPSRLRARALGKGRAAAAARALHGTAATSSTSVGSGHRRAGMAGSRGASGRYGAYGGFPSSAQSTNSGTRNRGAQALPTASPTMGTQTRTSHSTAGSATGQTPRVSTRSIPTARTPVTSSTAKNGRVLRLRLVP